MASKKPKHPQPRVPKPLGSGPQAVLERINLPRRGRAPLIAAAPGCETMATVLADFVSPLFEEHIAFEHFRILVSLGGQAWNTALATGEERERVVRLYEQAAHDEAGRIVNETRELLMARKAGAFGQYRQPFAEADVIDAGDAWQITVTMTSA